MDDTLKVLLEAMKETQDIINRQLDGLVTDHEKRLRYLERWIWRASGIMLAASTLVHIFWK